MVAVANPIQNEKEQEWAKITQNDVISNFDVKFWIVDWVAVHHSSKWCGCFDFLFFLSLSLKSLLFFFNAFPAIAVASVNFQMIRQFSQFEEIYHDRI